jgi:8-oxo-dGTP diphosphatase
MKQTTLCYIERDNKYLMLHRTKKERDENAGKWIGVGGKLEEGESPEDCAAREIAEETGLSVRRLSFRGIITFVSDDWGTEYMYLFTCSDFEGDITDCDEGELRWIPINDVEALPSWEGDRIFLRLLREREEFFSLKLCYNGETLCRAVLDGVDILP